jgi:CMP/dCMP kinase
VIGIRLKKLIIAIDGTAGSGKSTTARLVAERLNYLHIDTGAMYRAAAFAVLKAKVDPVDRARVEKVVAESKIRLQNTNGTEVLLNDHPVTDEIRKGEVTAIVSQISSYPMVRQRMVEEQRAIGRNGGVVLEGRDIGTVVFPHADIKFFFVADVEERARRRCKELVERGEPADFDTILNDIKARDHSDSTRAVSPLKKASDAITIDTSSISIDEQVEEVIRNVRKKETERTSMKG